MFLVFVLERFVLNFDFLGIFVIIFVKPSQIFLVFTLDWLDFLFLVFNFLISGCLFLLFWLIKSAESTKVVAEAVEHMFHGSMHRPLHIFEHVIHAKVGNFATEGAFILKLVTIFVLHFLDWFLLYWLFLSKFL